MIVWHLLTFIKRKNLQCHQFDLVDFLLFDSISLVEIMTSSCQKENQTKSPKESRDDAAKARKINKTKEASIKGGKYRPNPCPGKKSGFQTEHR